MEKIQNKDKKLKLLIQKKRRVMGNQTPRWPKQIIRRRMQETKTLTETQS